MVLYSIAYGVMMTGASVLIVLTLNIAYIRARGLTLGEVYKPDGQFYWPMASMPLTGAGLLVLGGIPLLFMDEANYNSLIFCVSWLLLNVAFGVFYVWFNLRYDKLQD